MPDMPIIPIQAAVLRAPGRPLKIERLEIEGPRGGLGTGIVGWFRVGQASNEAASRSSTPAPAAAAPWLPLWPFVPRWHHAAVLRTRERFSDLDIRTTQAFHKKKFNGPDSLRS